MACCKKCGMYVGVDRWEQRSRFGHINLTTPVVHTLFYKTMPNVLSTLLNVEMTTMRDLVDCKLHVVTRSTSKDCVEGRIISTMEYRKLRTKGKNYEVASGASAISVLLSKDKLRKLKNLLMKRRVDTTSNELLEQVEQKIEVIDGFIANNVSLDRMFIRILPVLPVGLRPMITLDDGKQVSSDLNELYKRIVIVNNNIMRKRQAGLGVDNFGEYINDLRLLQKTVDDLIDSSSNTEIPSRYNATSLKCLTETLRGKRGRFRYNVLGKRVDYSGRSVIVPGPDLSINECAIPRSMAFELFKPLIYSKLMLKLKIKEINHIIDSDLSLAYELLNEIVKYCPVLLNRAPTLHKLSMRSFWVKLTNEKVIRLHPLVCSGFNADFDGDQMAVHVPLSFGARIETILLLMTNTNMYHPAHGDPCILPSQDMVLGLYYMSLTSDEYTDVCFRSYNEVNMFLSLGKVNLHTKVKFQLKQNNKYITIYSTPGRLLISELIPYKCNFVYEWYHPELNKQMISDIVEFVNERCGQAQMVVLCERLMRVGFKYATQSGISLTKSELKDTSYKKSLIKHIRSVIIKTWSTLARGRTLPMFSSVWSKVLTKIYADINLTTTKCGLNQTSMQMIINSGARGTLSQVRQLIGSRGNVVGFGNKVCNMPIINAYNNGLSLIQFFCCTYASRRGLIDTVLKTASSGYLTRKLVESTREWVVNEEDCNTEAGLGVKPIIDQNFIKHRLIGRFLAKTICWKGRIIAKRNDLITKDNVSRILVCCDNRLWIRSPLTCQAKSGICKFCYGIELGRCELVQYGESIGVLAAQSIGEPGTQLTLRTFHGHNDIDENVGNKKIKNCLVASFSGVVKVKHLSCVCSNTNDVVVVNSECTLSITQNGDEVWGYKLSRGTRLLVSNGMVVNIGEILCFEYIKTDSLVSLANGLTTFEDLMYYLNLKTQINNKTGWIMTNVTPNVGNNKLMLVCLNVGKNIKLHYGFVGNTNKLVINSNMKVDLFDMFSEPLSDDSIEIDTTLSEGLERLSMLFDNNVVEDNTSIVCPTNGILRYGTDGNGNRMFIIDPVKLDERPVVCSGSDVELFIENNKMIKQGQVIIPGDKDLTSYAKTLGCNNFFNYFIETVQEIYGSHGVNVNSKHIEMVLRSMTNTVSTFDVSDSGNKIKEGNNTHDIVRTNGGINGLNGEQILVVRKVDSITDVCVGQSSILSAISFQGAIKVAIKAIMLGNRFDVTGIKDKIMLGKVPPFGTGMFINKINEK
ncbi:DNA-directed RNA polymerase subunit beta' [Candidatus Hodgkinia cicadicola]|nr:DNA-directed RNA polymerase subunit beta' [Candidatus Hodgkinia cicadicola]